MNATQNITEGITMQDARTIIKNQDPKKVIQLLTGILDAWDALEQMSLWICEKLLTEKEIAEHTNSEEFDAELMKMMKKIKKWTPQVFEKYDLASLLEQKKQNEPDHYLRKMREFFAFRQNFSANEVNEILMSHLGYKKYLKDGFTRFVKSN